MAMMPNRKLNDFFPLRFANGEQVRQFSKPCVQCGHMLHAKDMHGVARLVEQHIAIAATARCPSCGADFGVACVINDQKQVRRVILPRVLFGWYLRAMPRQADEQEPGSQTSAPVSNWPAAAPQVPAEPEAQPAIAAPAADVTRADEALGRYRDRPIPAWIEIAGRRLQFDRVAEQAGQGEYLLDGCLVYRDSQ